MRRRALILAILLALAGAAGGSAERGSPARRPSVERTMSSVDFVPSGAGGIVALSAGDVPALAEGALPADAAVVSAERLGDLWLLRLAADSGETLLLLADAGGMPVRLFTEAPAPEPTGGAQTASEAAEAALAALPGALVLQVDTEGSEKAVRVATPCLFGTVWVSGGQVRRRSLTGGQFVSGGRLTLDGAYHAAQLTRPEAVFLAVEYDDEDDAYEGDALLNGVEYEFQLDARTGRLLEWERD